MLIFLAFEKATLPGFDLTTNILSVAGGDDTSRPRQRTRATREFLIPNNRALE
jgi:hypothetical protein